MHDPLVVAFEIPRPWPNIGRHPNGQRAVYWPPLVTVWHREPGNKDSGQVCPWYRPDGKILHGWRWHVHHWRIQVPPLQMLRRRLLTRCSFCRGRDRKGDPVNTSLGWGKPREQRWWRGELGLYHDSCYSEMMELRKKAAGS